MTEFILDSSEMLFLMAAVNTSLILGIDNDRLVPNEQKQQQLLVRLGMEKLRQRGLLTVQDNTDVLHGDLGMMAVTIAYPRLITLLTRDVPGKGQQQFLHYRSDPVVAELTMPDVMHYRLAPILDSLSSLERMRTILSVTHQTDSVMAKQILKLQLFLQLKELAEPGQVLTAQALLEAEGFSEKGNEKFIQALRSPLLGGTIAHLLVDKQEIVDARNIALVSDTSAAWLIRPLLDAPDLLEIQTITAREYSRVLLTEINSLLPVAALME